MPVGGGGPTWLTGWIKLNNKHAVHVTSKSSKPEEEEEKCQQTATTARSPVTEISSKTASRNWSRKTKEQPIVIEESSETELPYHLSHQVSHQILSEAAFMIASADPELLSAELNPFPCGKPIRMSPEGLIVTTGVEKPQPHFNKAKTGNLNRLTSIFAREREPCQSCISLEQKLSAAYDDLEYMRGVAVHQASCGAQQHHAIEDACDGKCIQSSRTQPSATATNEFGELVKRHKQVVEALISERVK